MRFLRFILALAVLFRIGPCVPGQEPEKATEPNSAVPKKDQQDDPDNKRVHLTRFAIAPGHTASLPALSNESLMICLRGDSISRIPLQGQEEKWAPGHGSAVSNSSGVSYTVLNHGEIPAEILVVELKDSYAIDQLRVPWSERDPIIQDPAHFRIILENAHARVLLMRLNPREGTIESQFADRLDIALTGMHTSISDVDGKSYDVRRDARTVRWERAAMYSIVNLDEQALERLIVELKHPFCYPSGPDPEPPPGTSPNMQAYVSRVKDSIYKKWMKHMPSGVRGLEEKGAVLLQFKIDPDGTLQEDSLVFRIVFANGVLMEKALSAVREAAPFPPMPSDFEKPFLEARIVFTYNLPRQPPGCR